MGDATTVPEFSEESADAAASFAGLDEVLWNTISTATLLRSHPRFDERVLDAFSRDGASALPTAELVGIGGLVDAVEPAEPLVELARERAGERMPQLNLHVAEPAEWEPAGYDLVQCVLGIASFTDVEGGTRRLIDRARPGGRFAVTVWARGALDPLPDLLAASLPGAVSEVDGGGTGAAADVEDGDGAPAHTVEVADTAGSLAHWLTELGLVEVRAEAVQRHVDLGPDLAWRLVHGTGLRALIADLGESELDDVRKRYLGAIAARGVTWVDATTLIAVGRRPE
jgi:SAM-dependent methyltransferase